MILLSSKITEMFHHALVLNIFKIQGVILEMIFILENKVTYD
jgi:hypothetical protein